MARPRVPILHLPGTYSGALLSTFFEKSNKLHLWPRHLFKYSWQALPRSHRKRITSLTSPDPRPLPCWRLRDEPEEDKTPRRGRTLCLPQLRQSKLVRDAETGEVICTNCGFVLSDPAEQYAAAGSRRTEEGLLESQSGPPGRFSAFDKNSPRSFPERRRRTGH